MLHTLLTFTPLQDAREDTGTRSLLTCAALTQTLGPIPLASLDSNGWVVWEQKVALVDGRYIQLAPVVNGTVQAPTHCFDTNSRQQAVKMIITRDTQNPSLFYLTLEPFGSVPTSPLYNSLKLSNDASQNQPTPSLQIGSVRDKYLTSAQSFSLDYIGTLDTRPGRNAKLAFGNTIILWSESNAVHVEWLS